MSPTIVDITLQLVMARKAQLAGYSVIVREREAMARQLIDWYDIPTARAKLVH